VDAQTKTLKPEKAMEKGRKGRDTQRHRWRAKGRRGNEGGRGEGGGSKGSVQG